MMNPKRLNIIDIIIRRAPKNPRLSELEARLRSLEENGLPLPDVADFIESLDLVDREELDNALAGYLPVDYDFASLIDSLSLVTQERLDNALASYVENALDGYAKESALEGFATWASLNTEVARLDSKIDNLDLSDYATKQELNDAVDAIDLTGFATKSQVNTEVQRLDARIDNIDLTGFATKQELNDAVNGIDLTGFASTQELNTEIARLEAEIESIDVPDVSGLATKNELDAEVERLDTAIENISVQPSPSAESFGFEVKFADFCDFVLVKNGRYFAVKPDDYNIERFPLAEYNPIGFVAYPVHGGLSGGLFTRVLSFRWINPADSRGSATSLNSLCFRGTTEPLELPKFQEYWNGILTLDNTMCGKEATSYILANEMRLEYQNGTPSNEPYDDCFPAFAAAFQFEQGNARYGTLYSSPYWYIPSSSEISSVFSNTVNMNGSHLNRAKMILDDFIQKTDGAVITEAFSPLMTSTLGAEPGKYITWTLNEEVFPHERNESGRSEERAFTETCPVRAMIRLI